jgi:hypothetical protein
VLADAWLGCVCVGIVFCVLGGVISAKFRLSLVIYRAVMSHLPLCVPYVVLEGTCGCACPSCYRDLGSVSVSYRFCASMRGLVRLDSVFYASS